MRTLSAAVALTLLTATTITATAQTPEQPSPQSHPLAAQSAPVPCELKREALKDPAAATAFAAASAQDGMTEVALAGLALQKSHNDQVRQFAEKMVLDYAQSNGALDSIVKCEGLILPTGVDAKHNALVRSLVAKSGSAFDKAYLKHLEQKHSEVAALFESASRAGDPDLAAFAQKGLSMLQEQRLLADNLRGSGTNGLSTR